jgi:ribonuclease P protein component
MLPKENRLKKKKDFEKAFRQGKGIKQDLLFLKLLKNNLNVTRFGFIVSKKLSKKATVRNKIRRRLSEVIRTNLEGIKKGWDGVIVASPGIENKNFQEIKESISRLFKKANLIK